MIIIIKAVSFLNRWVFFIKEEFCKVVSILMKATPNSSHIAVGVMGYQVTADMAHLKDTFILHQMFSRTPKSIFFQIKGTLMKNVFLAFKRRSKIHISEKKKKKEYENDKEVRSGIEPRISQGWLY